jgi:hypothetical protein
LNTGLEATMPDVDIRSISVCIQALQDAIRHYEFLCQSQTVDPDDYEEAKYMYELELARLSEIYAAEEKLGRTSIPLAALLRKNIVQKT